MEYCAWCMLWRMLGSFSLNCSYALNRNSGGLSLVTTYDVRVHNAHNIFRIAMCHPHAAPPDRLKGSNESFLGHFKRTQTDCRTLSEVWPVCLGNSIHSTQCMALLRAWHAEKSRDENSIGIGSAAAATVAAVIGRPIDMFAWIATGFACNSPEFYASSSALCNSATLHEYIVVSTAIWWDYIPFGAASLLELLGWGECVLKCM